MKMKPRKKHTVQSDKTISQPNSNSHIEMQSKLKLLENENTRLKTEMQYLRRKYQSKHSAEQKKYESVMETVQILQKENAELKKKDSEAAEEMISNFRKKSQLLKKNLQTALEANSKIHDYILLLINKNKYLEKEYKKLKEASYDQDGPFVSENDSTDNLNNWIENDSMPCSIFNHHEVLRRFENEKNCQVIEVTQKSVPREQNTDMNMPDRKRATKKFENELDISFIDSRDSMPDYKRKMINGLNKKRKGDNATMYEAIKKMITDEEGEKEKMLKGFFKWEQPQEMPNTRNTAFVNPFAVKSKPEDDLDPSNFELEELAQKYATEEV